MSVEKSKVCKVKLMSYDEFYDRLEKWNRSLLTKCEVYNGSDQMILL